ncbi:MAG: hypothetical protein P8M03_05450 [Flavobacteriaceae bacterium]|nr:hypothetical protein [Flavobacteriaceae bacterium]
MQKSILFLFLLFSCSKSQDISFEDNLNGKWILNKVTCYCFFGEEYDFSKNSIVFNKGKILISNENDKCEFIANCGTYDFLITTKVITIEKKSYNYSIENNILTLLYIDVPEIADDEISYEFVKDE